MCDGSLDTALMLISFRSSNDETRILLYYYTVTFTCGYVSCHMASCLVRINYLFTVTRGKKHFSTKVVILILDVVNFMKWPNEP